ncbi:MAG: glycerate kinase, partial [Micrococcales bacterium]|nr:glycerate kinase [Micrococcales bacterium]
MTESQPAAVPVPVFLVAPDKFKGTLTAPEAAEAIAEGLRAAVPEARIRTLPIADGGEGTVDAVVAAGGERRVARVTGPLGQPVDAVWALLPTPQGPTAVLESAAACGLHLVVPSPASALE